MYKYNDFDTIILTDFIKSNIKSISKIITIKTKEWNLIFDINPDKEFLYLTWINITNKNIKAKNIIKALINICYIYKLNYIKALCAKGKYHNTNAFGYYALLKLGFLPKSINIINNQLKTQYGSFKEAFSNDEFWIKWREFGIEYTGEFHLSNPISLEMFNKNFINENYSQENNFLRFYHGGNLDNYKDKQYNPKKGRFEWGPGLYLTSNINVALKYSKGKKLYYVEVERGNDLNSSLIDIKNLYEFCKQEFSKATYNFLISRYAQYINNDKIKGYIVLNVLINNNLLKPSNANSVKEFFKNNNIDYSLDNNAFGFGELMMVLFNIDKIKTIKQIKNINEYPENFYND